MYYWPTCQKTLCLKMAQVPDDGLSVPFCFAELYTFSQLIYPIQSIKIKTKDYIALVYCSSGSIGIQIKDHSHLNTGNKTIARRIFAGKNNFYAVVQFLKITSQPHRRSDGIPIRISMSYDRYFLRKR